jgi:general stress protein 26
MKVIKYLINKKGTKKVEGVTSGGQGFGDVTALVDIDNSLNNVTLFNSEDEAYKAIHNKRKYIEEHPNKNIELYYYDSKTKPEDLIILKLTIEEIE